MPCTSPLQAYYFVRPDGKKQVRFSNFLAEQFCDGVKMPKDSLSVACGQCMSCRLDRSREAALRCVHESRVFKDSCFITLTYSDDFLKSNCPLTPGGYSLDRKDISNFVKRLRERFSRGFTYFLRDGKEREYRSDLIRVFGCGEYGGQLGRPHFHLCLFNCCFPDRVYGGRCGEFNFYNSPVLESLWRFGFSTVCDFSFETASYVARYVTKKVTGQKAIEHYRGRLPEFSIFPTRGGGLGKPWFERFARTDVFPTDSCVVRGVKCLPPRYYDRLRERLDPLGYAEVKSRRIENGALHADDRTHARLLDLEKCVDAKMKFLIRKMERQC